MAACDISIGSRELISELPIPPAAAIGSVIPPSDPDGLFIPGGLLACSASFARSCICFAASARSALAVPGTSGVPTPSLSSPAGSVRPISLPSGVSPGSFRLLSRAPTRSSSARDASSSPAPGSSIPDATRSIAFAAFSRMPISSSNPWETTLMKLISSSAEAVSCCTCVFAPAIRYPTSSLTVADISSIFAARSLLLTSDS